jgi:hypothetical protein
MDLPPEYVAYVQSGGTMEAFLTCDFPGYMQLWPLEKVSEYNNGYQIAEFAPGFFGFGTNGGGELLVFDASGAVYCLPAIGLEPECATRIANSWTDFSCYIEPPAARE